MQTAIQLQPEESDSETKTLPAAVCKQCGAKIYPTRFLKTHMTRHQLKQRRFKIELKKLQYTMARMREIA